MKNTENKSIINWEVYQRLKKTDSKIYKEIIDYKKKPTVRGLWRSLIAWFRNKFLSFRN